MQGLAETDTKTDMPASSWRISLDRAWRSRSMRRAFETETGLPPLAQDADAERAQRQAGGVQVYHGRFILWATRRLGLEGQAPTAIQGQLARRS